MCPPSTFSFKSYKASSFNGTGSVRSATVIKFWKNIFYSVHLSFLFEQEIPPVTINTMLTLSEIKTGKHIILNDDPYLVLYHEHSKMGRAGAVLRTKVRNLKTGASFEKTFQGADKVEEAEIIRSKSQYLYHEREEYYFMDNTSFEQFFLFKDALKDTVFYLIEGTEVDILYFHDMPINIELPVKMRMRVIEAPPGIKGDTASAGTKVVTLETGLKVTTPLFVNVDDSIVINTQTGEYVSRA